MPRVYGLQSLGVDAARGGGADERTIDRKLNVEIENRIANDPSLTLPPVRDRERRSLGRRGDRQEPGPGMDSATGMSVTAVETEIGARREC